MAHRRIAGIALAFMAVFAAACSSNDTTSTTPTTGGGSGSTTAGSTAADTPQATGEAGGALTLGLLVPESGDLSAIVNSLAQPSQLAVKQINDAGGVNGKPVKMVQADDGTDPQVAATSLNKLLSSDKVNAIVGPAPSGVARGIMDKIKSAGVVACSGSTTAADLTELDSGGFFFRTAPSDELQGPALAEVITTDGHKNVGILARRDEYGTGFAKSLEDGLKNNGANVVANVTYAPDGSNFSAEVSQVTDKSPDAIAVIGFNDDGAKIISALIAKGSGPDKVATYTADGMQSSKFAASVDPNNPGAVKGIKGTAPAAAPEGVTSPFQQQFPSLGVDPIFSSYYWDCTNLIALAAESAKSSDPAKIRDAFAKNLEGDNECNDFASCKKFLAEGKTIHYQGASNAFETWDVVQPATGAYEIWQYDAAGKVETLKVPQIKV